MFDPVMHDLNAYMAGVEAAERLKRQIEACEPEALEELMADAELAGEFRDACEADHDALNALLADLFANGLPYGTDARAAAHYDRLETTLDHARDSFEAWLRSTGRLAKRADEIAERQRTEAEEAAAEDAYLARMEA